MADSPSGAATFDGSTHSSQPHAKTRWFPWKVFVSSLTIMMALLTAWSFASPLMSIPDEASHTIRAAAVVRGEIMGSSEDKYRGKIPGIEVPAYINHALAMGCFAFNPGKSAACQTEYQGNPDVLVLSASSAQPNSPVYYAIVGLPTLVSSGNTALYAMRLVSSLLVSAIVALTFAMLAMRRRSIWSIFAYVVALTPMMLFLGGSINPNAVEAASAASLFVALVSIIRERPSGSKIWFFGASAVASIVLVTSGRSIGLLWVLLVAVAALFYIPGSGPGLFRKRSTWIVLAVCGVAAIGALAWFVSPQPSTGPPANIQGSLLAVAQQSFERGLDYWSGMIGYFGWLDTASPTITYFVWDGLIIAFIIGAVLLGRGRSRWVTLGFGVALIVIPVIIQATLYRQFGWVWQGRYVLAILLLAMIAAGMALDSAGRSLTPATVRVLRASVVAMAIGHLAAFVWALRRYVVATDSWIAMLKTPLWQPPLTWIFWTIFFAAVLSVSSAVIWKRLGSSRSASGSMAANDADEMDDKPHQWADAQGDDAFRGRVER